MKILIAEPKDYSTAALAVYAKIGEVVLLPELSVPLQQAIGDADVLVIRLAYKIDKEIINTAKHLKYILTPTTGTDHIDEDAAKERGIKIISLKNEVAFLNAIPSTAELTWGLLLSLVRKIPAAYNDVNGGNWDREKFRGNNLRHKKIGIIGLGRVGRQIAHFAKAFGMEIMAYDPYQEEWLDYVVKANTPEELVRWADIISIHIPHANNDKFISGQMLQQAKEGVLLINTSRGSVWDEDAVAALLLSGHLGGVATDVVTDEQNDTVRKNNPLIKQAGKLPNLIITPHIAGITYESMYATENFIADKFMKVCVA